MNLVSGYFLPYNEVLGGTMTVINQYIIGRKTTADRSFGVQDVRTIGDYLPAIVGIGCAAIAGTVTTVLMFLPTT